MLVYQRVSPNESDSSTKRPYPGPGFFKPGRALSATFRLS